MKAAIDGDSRIVVMTETLTAPEMAGLIDAADVVLSLHRSEGFGLLLAQAMLAGKPVIATNWSGNCDFMSEENSFLVPYTLVPVKDPQGIYQRRALGRAGRGLCGAVLATLLRQRRCGRTIGERAAQSAQQKFGPALEDAYRRRLGEFGSVVRTA